MHRVLFLSFFSRRRGKVGVSLGLERRQGAGAHAMQQHAPTAMTQCIAFLFLFLFCAAAARCTHHLGLSIIKELGHVQCGNVP
jgi:hypothetical protein